MYVSDGCGSAKLPCSITINPPPSLTCAAINTGEVGVKFDSGPMTVNGGTSPYTFSIATGTLPAGLTLNASTGEITGTPTAAGTFTLQVKDFSGVVSTATCSITINPKLSVACASLNTATVGAPFNSGPITVTGGTTPYTFSIVGTLPAGLTLNATTGAVTGTPTASGSFSIQVQDAGGAIGATCPISSVPCQASVCGFVFADCDGNGFLTPGIDIGMPKVVVTLKNSKGVTVTTATTDSQGSYCFTNLTPGTYTACIAQPTNCIQTAGTHTTHWLNNNYQQCWKENDGYQHCKGGDGVDRWTASDGCQHWKNSSGQDCWKDKNGYSHSQNCNYVSCDVPKGNCETVTLTCGQALTSVNFAYQGILPKCVVSVTGPSKCVWGQTATYTCFLQNTGTACFTACQVKLCGKSYNCPALGPGQSCSFTCNYQFQWSDWGNFKCQATANCTPAYTSSNYSNNSSSCTAQGSCNTSVSLW